MAKYIETIGYVCRRVTHNNCGSATYVSYSIRKNGDIVELYHYGTLIIVVDIIMRELIYVNITSRSDCDAVNTLIQFYKISCYHNRTADTFAGEELYVSLSKDGSYRVKFK